MKIESKVYVFNVNCGKIKCGYWSMFDLGFILDCLGKWCEVFELVI